MLETGDLIFVRDESDMGQAIQTSQATITMLPFVWMG